ncbi:MAG: 2-dehydropantoate 2-reductase N-terminal domain-containing protein [Acidobacteriota bacterium]|nr:2-dehydropantoate 2-reductase N-terminal domain-containing protein [Acidobacteriota bacterium]
MRYVIYGAGGIGGGIGAMLADGGQDVSLIARGPHLDAICRQGLAVHTPEGVAIHRLRAVGHPADLDLRGDEVFIFTMKSQDTLGALEDLRAVAGSRVSVVLAQNGVANERSALRRFDSVYGMLVYMPAQFLDPGTIVLHATPLRGTLHAGRYPSGVDTTIERVCADLRSGGFDADPEPEVMRLKYGKLLMNLGNAAQALAGIEADLGQLTRELRREARACLEAAAIEFVKPRELVELCRAGYSLGEVDGAKRMGGSSWQGMMRGNRSIETDFLNGEIVLLGAQLGVPTPLNRAVQTLATDGARLGRPPGSLTIDEIFAAASSAA